MSLFIIAWQDLKRMAKDPVGLVLILATPLVLIVSLGMVSGRYPGSPAPADGFDALSYIAPGMALFFVMFAVTRATRMLAEDADRGLRDRLRAAPLRPVSLLLAGSLSLIALVFLQLLVLVEISTLLYRLSWGGQGEVILLSLALAGAAGGWGALLAAVGRTPTRIGAVGTALMLIFGIVSRSFAAVIPAPPWMESVARITPNWWGIHGFTELAFGGGLASIASDIAALIAMGAALFALARFAALIRPGKRN